jgi:hypothetical protein
LVHRLRIQSKQDVRLAVLLRPRLHLQVKTQRVLVVPSLALPIVHQPQQMPLPISKRLSSVPPKTTFRLR